MGGHQEAQEMRRTACPLFSVSCARLCQIPFFPFFCVFCVFLWLFSIHLFCAFLWQILFFPLFCVLCVFLWLFLFTTRPHTLLWPRL